MNEDFDDKNDFEDVCDKSNKFGFCCKVCNLEFSTTADLKTHISDMIKPFACTECKFKSDKESHLKIHMEIIHGFEPYKAISQSSDEMYEQYFEKDIITLLEENGVKTENHLIEYDDTSCNGENYDSFGTTIVYIKDSLRNVASFI